MNTSLFSARALASASLYWFFIQTGPPPWAVQSMRLLCLEPELPFDIPERAAEQTWQQADGKNQEERANQHSAHA